MQTVLGYPVIQLNLGVGFNKTVQNILMFGVHLLGSYFSPLLFVKVDLYDHVLKIIIVRDRERALPVHDHAAPVDVLVAFDLDLASYEISPQQIDIFGVDKFGLQINKAKFPRWWVTALLRRRDGLQVPDIIRK